MDYDLIVVGTGGGLPLAYAASEAGWRVAVVDRGLIGGTCLNYGCIPTKMLTTAADRVREAEGAARINVTIPHAAVDWPGLAARVNQRLSGESDMRQELLDEPNLDFYPASARFSAPRELTVEFDGRQSTLTAPRIVLATGAKSRILQYPGLRPDDWVDASRFFGDLPEALWNRVAIVGGGVIAAEFAHILNAFGCEVHILQRNVRLLPRHDTELAGVVSAALAGAGVHLSPRTTVSRVDHNPDGSLELNLIRENWPSRLTVDKIFFATGFEAWRDLDTGRGGIETDRAGWIKVNEFLETSCAGVYALGDCTGTPQLRHKANYEAEILMHNFGLTGEAPAPADARYPVDNPRWARYDHMPQVVYTWPELASVGLDPMAAQVRAVPVQIGRLSYAAVAKGWALGYTDEEEAGFARLLTDLSGERLLGFQAVGPNASLLLQTYVLSLNSVPAVLSEHIRHPEIGSERVQALRRSGLVRELPAASIRSIDETMVAHPSLSEVAAWATDELRPPQWQDN